MNLFKSFDLIILGIVFIVALILMGCATLHSDPLLTQGNPPIYAKTGIITTVKIGHIINTKTVDRKLIRFVSNASKDSHIKILLSGNGGLLDGATIPLIEALLSSKAKITMVVTGNVYSAHAILACAGNQPVQFKGGRYIMFHLPRDTWMDGKVRKWVIEYKHKWFNNFIKVCQRKGLISAAELKHMNTGKDIWLKTTKVAKRVNGR